MWVRQNILHDVVNVQELRMSLGPSCKIVFNRLTKLLARAYDSTIVIIDDKQKIDTLRFEMSAVKLKELLLKRQICAADLRCLDNQSKQCLRGLCLQTCLRSECIIQKYMR